LIIGVAQRAVQQRSTVSRQVFCSDAQLNVPVVHSRRFPADHGFELGHRREIIEILTIAAKVSPAIAALDGLGPLGVGKLAACDRTRRFSARIKTDLT
jgi:hypothetical protein